MLRWVGHTKPQTVAEADIGGNRNNSGDSNLKLPKAPGPALFRPRLVICVYPQTLTHEYVCMNVYLYFKQQGLKRKKGSPPVSGQ